MRARIDHCWRVLGVALAMCFPPRLVEAVSSGMPVDTPAAELWRHTGQLDIKHWMDGYRWIGRLHDGVHGRAAACRQHNAELTAALAADPASLALWVTAYDCAEADHDAPSARRASANLLALFRDGLDNRPVGDDDATIRVGMPADAFLLASHIGEQVEYAWYDVFSRDQYVPLHMVLWDARTRRERWLNFDFSETVTRIGDREHADFPVTRMKFARDMLQLTARDPGTIAAGALQALAARDASNGVDAMVSKMVPLAQAGHYEAAYALGMLCLAQRHQPCARQAVDVLLPWAERHAAQPLLFLASAYANGDGVKADHDAALLLLDSAERRLGNGRGLLWYATHLMRAEQPGPIDADVLARIGQQRDRGDLLAGFWLAARTMMAHPQQESTNAQRAVLERASGRGLRKAMAFYAASLEQHQPALARAWWLKAAHAGDPMAEDAVALQWRLGRAVERDPAQALDWYRRAAAHGNRDALRYMAGWSQSLDASPDHLQSAQRWLQSAVVLGDQTATLPLALLYIDGGPKLDHDRVYGLQLLRSLTGRPDGAEARRHLAALMVEGLRVPRDPDGAVRLLENDARSGDVAAQTALGELLLRHDNPSRAPDTALRLLQDAAGHGSTDAMAVLGEAYLYGAFGGRDPRLSLNWWRKAADRGSVRASNDLAWSLCTSPDATLRDPRDGMAYARWLESRDDLDPAGRDTVAACYAAVGQFDRAVTIEQSAVKELARKGFAGQRMEPAYRARVAEYRQHVAFLDWRDPTRN